MRHDTMWWCTRFLGCCVALWDTEERLNVLVVLNEGCLPVFDVKLKNENFMYS